MNKIYISNNTIFIPCSKTVERVYENGEVGDALWIQVYKGVFRGNYWTLKEIMALGATPITADQLAMIPIV